MDRYEICLAYASLEDHYNKDGFLAARPSNRRRNESTGCQLARMGFSLGMDYLDPYALGADQDHEEAQTIYWCKALDWGLPLDREALAVVRTLFVPEYLAQHGIAPDPEARP